MVGSTLQRPSAYCVAQLRGQNRPMDTLAKMSLVEPEDMKQWIAIRQNRDDSESESDGFQATGRIMAVAKAFSNSTGTWPPLRIQVGEDSPRPFQVSNRLMANRGPLSHRIRIKRESSTRSPLQTYDRGIGQGSGNPRFDRGHSMALSTEPADPLK